MSPPEKQPASYRPIQRILSTVSPTYKQIQKKWMGMQTTPVYRFIENNADQTTAALWAMGGLALAKAGNFDDFNGNSSNYFLSASGIVEFITEGYQFICKKNSKPGPGYVLGGLLMMASGLGIVGISQGSGLEIATGSLQTAGALAIFYGDRFLPKGWIKDKGPVIGGLLYLGCCVPLLAAGIVHGNTWEWGSVIPFAIGNLTIMTKKQGPSAPSP